MGSAALFVPRQCHRTLAPVSCALAAALLSVGCNESFDDLSGTPFARPSSRATSGSGTPAEDGADGDDEDRGGAGGRSGAGSSGAVGGAGPSAGGSGGGSASSGGSTSGGTAPGGGAADGSSGGAPSTGGAPTGPYAAELQFCIDETNRYRATLGRPALVRSAALEDFAARAAESDGQTNRPHGYFSRTGGAGVAMAENAVPGWPMGSGVRSVVAEGLEMMWDEGPGGGHYENMASRRYSEVGCGVYVTSGNRVWVVQNFR